MAAQEVVAETNALGRGAGDRIYPPLPRPRRIPVVAPGGALRERGAVRRPRRADQGRGSGRARHAARRRRAAPTVVADRAAGTLSDGAASARGRDARRAAEQQRARGRLPGDGAPRGRRRGAPLAPAGGRRTLGRGRWTDALRRVPARRSGPRRRRSRAPELPLPQHAAAVAAHRRRPRSVDRGDDRLHVVDPHGRRPRCHRGLPARHDRRQREPAQPRADGLHRRRRRGPAVRAGRVPDRARPHRPAGRRAAEAAQAARPRAPAPDARAARRGPPPPRPARTFALHRARPARAGHGARRHREIPGRPLAGGDGAGLDVHAAVELRLRHLPAEPRPGRSPPTRRGPRSACFRTRTSSSPRRRRA
jgi:hypothetical protein